ncbi:MAG TPA: hypothetical protein VMF61_03425, partial [Candidatus Acidoferrales bacterium]|nr:hypothetical protein [Candidatus Acidoferrales bacterium]
VADSADNTVVEIFDAALLNKAKSIVVGANGKTFSGPDAKYAKVFHTGLPLSMPGGVTMLYEQVVSGAPTAPGNLVVANSAGKNELVEFSPAGKPLDRLVVDKGAPGALFGMQAIGSGAATKLYLTDSNSNTIQVLQK